MSQIFCGTRCGVHINMYLLLCLEMFVVNILGALNNNMAHRAILDHLI